MRRAIRPNNNRRHIEIQLLLPSTPENGPSKKHLHHHWHHQHHRHSKKNPQSPPPTPSSFSPPKRSYPNHRPTLLSPAPSFSIPPCVSFFVRFGFGPVGLLPRCDVRMDRLKMNDVRIRCGNSNLVGGVSKSMSHFVGRKRINSVMISKINTPKIETLHLHALP